MSEQTPYRRRTSRRSFIKAAGALGLGAAGAAVFPSSDLSVIATRYSQRPGKRVRRKNVTDQTDADFAAGRSSGAGIHGAGTNAALHAKPGANFTSRVIAAPFAPTHVGLHWKTRGARPSDVAVSVRGSANGKNWSQWQSVSIEAIANLDGDETIPVHGPAPDGLDNQGDNIEVFASLLGLDRPAFLQYQAQFNGGQEVALDQMTLTAIDASTDDSDSASGFFATAQAAEVPTNLTLQNAAGLSLDVITREGWLDEDNQGKTTWEPRFVPVKKIFLHHTATSNNYSDGAAEVRAIHAYHAYELGWGDIGYQMLVDRSGKVYEGRRGRDGTDGREILSNGVEAGHTYAYNYGTTSIAAIGDSQKGRWDRFWGDAGLDAIVDAVAFECGRHYLDPEGESDFLRSDRVWHQGPLQHCVGHQDADGSGGSTACPGNRLYDFLNNELRQAVADRLDGAPAAPTGLTGSQNGDTLEFAWDSGDGDFEYFFEGWWRRVEEDADGNEVSYMEYLTDHSKAFKSHDWAGTDETDESNVSGQSWSGNEHTGSSEDFKITERGQYTLHVRRDNGYSFASHYTVLAEEVEAPEDPATGSISGIVEGDETALEGVLVEVEGTKLSIKTDENGKYTLNDVPTGEQGVKASLEGYATETRSVEVQEDSQAKLNFTLEPATIGGVVYEAGTDQTKTIAGETVMLDGVDNDYYDVATTLDDGEFLFEGVPAGTYEVTADAEGYDPDTWEIEYGADSIVEILFELVPEGDGGDGEEPADPVIDQFDISSRTTGPWRRVDTSWTVSHADEGLETVTSELLDGEGNVLDSVTSDVSGSTASGEHELRTRDNGAASVRLTVTAADKSTSKEEDV